MSTFWLIIHVIEILLWLLLAASGAYILFFALVSMLWKKPVSPLSAYLEGQIRSMREPRQYTFLVLYPAYNEDRVIINSVHTFLGQYYPYKGFHVAVISDHMQPETNEQLAQLPITLLQPVFEKSSKAKAMQYALQQIKGDYDYVVILDADNVVESDFLAKLNDALCTAVERIKADEIAAVWLCPAADAVRCDLFFKTVENGCKSRCEKCLVLFHMLFETLKVLEELNVAQLIYLIGTNRLHGEQRADIV